MKKLQFCLALLLACVLNFNVSAQASWTILRVSGSGAQITSNTPYNLQAVKDKAILAYKSRKYGINLSWGTAKERSANFQFVKEGGGAINCGDRIALFCDDGGYIKYEKREWGINLVWSKTPVYEWEIRNADNQKGTPILPNTPIALYNARENDFMRKCTRSASPTVDLAWVLDCPNGYRLPGALASTTYNNMTRDQVVKYAIKVAITAL